MKGFEISMEEDCIQRKPRWWLQARIKVSLLKKSCIELGVGAACRGLGSIAGPRRRLLASANQIWMAISKWWSTLGRARSRLQMLPLARITPLGLLKLVQAGLDDLVERAQHKSQYTEIKQ